ncbi:UDP-2-acetamido-2,6-beta-L-arabino-hexul-4-ose reductase [bioreactor metagenome]|uniref:UDP-2-acetamido-2,6-beta-L-arabino-hexul-4-ose reductase n=1 Tax=bioreactor metagenome TaxID=1076179 RepID=A0A645HFD1_9ZZZZ
MISGKGAIRFRKIGEPEAAVIEYIVSGEKIEVVDIPAGYTHNIENMGDTDMVTLMWANEKFYPARPDTFFESV